LGSKVSRTVWLALICLISLGILFAVRSNTGARSMPPETASIEPPSTDPAIDEEPPLAKSDRLPSPNIDRPAVKPTDTVQSPPNAPEAAIILDAKRVDDTAPKAKSGVNEVRTWHWHRGSKISKRITVVEPGKQPAIR
jgi:hypothetical protein